MSTFLLDLCRILPFYIDDDVKKKLCFSETLLVSYCHEKEIELPENKAIKTSESISNTVGSKNNGLDKVISSDHENSLGETSSCDFHFYFYRHDVEKKPLSKNDSVIIVDGLPKLNPKRLGKYTCPEFHKESHSLISLESSFSAVSSCSLSKGNELKSKKWKGLCKCTSNNIHSVCECTSDVDKLIRNKSLVKMKRTSTSPNCAISETKKHIIKGMDEDFFIKHPDETSSNFSCTCNCELSDNMKNTVCQCDIPSIACVCNEPQSSCQCEIPSTACVCNELQSSCQCEKIPSTACVCNEPQSSCQCEPPSPGCVCKSGDVDVCCECKQLSLADISIEKDCVMIQLNALNSFPTGGMTISVQTVGLNNDKFSIYSSTEYTDNGYETGTNLLATVDLNLHTIEENRSEHMKNNENIFCEHLYNISLCEGGYQCISTCIKDEDKNIEYKYFQFNEADNFLLDGGSMVLLRYIALTHYQGTFSTKYINIYGNVCDCCYVCRLVDEMEVNNIKIPVMIILKKKLDNDQLESSECYFFTLTGHLIQCQFSDSKFIIHMNPLMTIDAETNQLRHQIPLRFNWKKDMQIFSEYLKLKDQRLMENESYLSSKVQLQSLLTDYFQTILLMKPRDVISFTKSYFSNFSKTVRLPFNPYFDKNLHHVRYSYY